MATLNHVRFRAPPESARGGRKRRRAAAHARARQSLACQGTRRARCPLRASRRVALGPARSPRRPARRSKNPSGSGSVARAIAVGGNSRGRGTHVTTRAGGLVATIRASLLRHGVCLGPARSRVPWRARRGVSLRAMRFRVRDGRFAEAKPRREPRRVVRARGAQRVHRGLGPSPESSRERKPGFPRTCCVAATRKRSEWLSRTRVKFLSRR